MVFWFFFAQNMNTVNSSTKLPLAAALQLLLFAQLVVATTASMSLTELQFTFNRILPAVGL